ncbi:ornithine cyclodeaminase family protein [Acidisoma sp. S159]|uniref:ornithine cyclodeaminase family protein n=1 Tax=Acidisoma sp. S159 TaxID=1747225 RepID=UPI00131AB20D|nr:ornithine cyclodeaminase [Acidisoma sp. S159]
MHFVANADVHRLLPYPDLVQALRVAHRGGKVASKVLHIDEPGGSNLFLALGAWRPNEAISVKLVGVFPGNLSLDPPQPTVQGIVAMFDATTGAAMLAADGAAMTERKTAADSALGVDLLARRNAATLLVVGAGALAPHVVEAFLTVRPSLRRVLIWNRTPARAQALVSRLSHPGIAIAWAPDLDAAITQADIISCVTMSETPLVKGALLRPGAHLDLIGAYLPQMRESDDEVMRRGRIFIDNATNIEGSGDLASPLRDGVITRDDILADLWQLCTGDALGRMTLDEITVFKNIGGSHLDLFTIAWLREQWLLEQAVP